MGTALFLPSVIERNKAKRCIVATSVVFVTLGAVLGLVLCFSSYRLKEKPYLYIRNAILVAFGSLFLLTMLLEGSFDGISLNGVGFSAMLKLLKTTHVWWEIILKLLVPMVAVLTTIFLAELPTKAYEVLSSLFVAIPLACGLYISPDVSQTMFIGLTAAYAVALVVVGILMFRTYLCIEAAAVGGFLVSWLFKGFYALSNVTFVVVGGVFTIAGAVTTIALARRSDAKNAAKKPPCATNINDATNASGVADTTGTAGTKSDADTLDSNASEKDNGEGGGDGR